MKARCRWDGDRFSPTHDVLVDSRQPLMLPVDDLVGSIAKADAIAVFDRLENHRLVNPGGATAASEGKALWELGADGSSAGADLIMRGI